MKIVFMGTSDFAVTILAALHKSSRHEVLAVVTQPDRGTGRGKKKFGPVKVYAENEGLALYQPERVKSSEFVEILRRLQPEAIVVAAYGQILSEEILNLPRYGCINVHGSLLPKYRGAAPAQYAIWHGEKLSGVTIMQMDKGMDTGAMFDRVGVPISEQMTSGELLEAMAREGALALLRNLERIEAGTALLYPQNNYDASYAHMLTREMEKIVWEESAEQLHNKIRAFNPVPGAYGVLKDGRELKIWRSEPVSGSGKPGEVLLVDKQGFVVACGRGALRILEVQPAGKKLMDAGAFVNGRGVVVGDILS